MPDSILNHTATGWPYLDNDNYLNGVIPAYTLELAGKLNNADADVAAAINAAAAAQAAAYGPAGRLQLALNQTIAAGVAVVIKPTAAILNQGGMYEAPSTGNGQTGGFRIQQTGIYQVTATVGFAANGTGIRALYLYAGANIIGETTQPPIAANGPSLNASSGAIRLDANTLVTVRVFQTSGGNLATSNSAQQAVLAAHWVCAAT